MKAKKNPDSDKNLSSDIKHTMQLGRLISFCKSYIFLTLLTALVAVLLSVFGVLRPYLLQLAIDQGVVLKSSHSLHYYMSMLLVCLLLDIFCQFSFVLLANILGQSVTQDIRNKLFSKILYFKQKYYDSVSIGRLVTRVVGDVETITSIFSQGLFMVVSDLLKIFVILVFMLYKSWKLTLVVWLVFPFVLYATRVFQKKMKKAFKEVRKQVADLNAFVQERLNGLRIVQLFVREDQEFDKFEKINTKHRDAWIKTVWYNSFFFPITEMGNSITIGLIVWYGGHQVFQNSTITIGVVIAFVELSQLLFRPLRQIADKFNTLQMGIVACSRVFDVLDQDESLKDQGSKHFLKELHKGISFKNVSFYYKPQEPVLRSLSLQFQAKKTTAVIGQTGAGKSTIIQLINRCYDVQSGSIDIDGVDINDISLAELRKSIAIVTQDLFLFSDTILNNVTLYDPSISLEQVKQAAKSIGADEFIEELPDAYYYKVSERGKMLSTGQRQLISFLRAYVRQPKILILDEATASIDPQSEKQIQLATQKITQGRTSIIIAHRLNTIENADQIVVLDKGRVLEVGTHDTLIVDTSSRYYQLQNA